MAFEHVFYDSVSLNGDWEMSYRPYAHETDAYPAFKGKPIARAVPGYWEDMGERFQAAELTGPFRINPWHERQSLPIRGAARDTTLPDIYGCFYYRRTVSLDRSGPAVLRFEGVRNQVHVWINGQFVGFRAGFSTPFELPVPDALLRIGSNEVVLAVSNNPVPGYCDYVSGLTTRAVFRSTGGVNGDLELRFPKNDLADVYTTTAKDLKTFTVHVSGETRYSYIIADGARIMAQGEAQGDFSIGTEGYEFWSPEKPKRYELRIQSGHGVYSQLFGIRRLAADGERLRLNGAPVYLRGVTEHCFFPKTIHVPRDLGYFRMVTAKRKELGFNFVRFHTFVPPVEYLEATDELGMLVHIESPNFVSEPEYAAIIAFARRHPSVVIYCTGNETRIDRIAETYLEDVAQMVHQGTDALFSPMSAMRGVEYALMPGKDAIAETPFPHNPERMRRLARYCDMWTSYQIGRASYFSLNSEPASFLDALGDAYCGKPRTSHEICIDGSYADLSLEKIYPADSPIVKAGIFSEIREMLSRKGLLDCAEAYFRNSCEWMRRIRKFTFEKVRASERTAGYDFLGDINTHWHTFGYSVGMMDEFYRLKPGETVQNVLGYNSAAVLLCDMGSDFNMTAGEVRTVSFSVSNYAEDCAGAMLDVALVDAESGETVWGESRQCGSIPNGRLTSLPACAVAFPASSVARKYLLRASLGALARNEWEVYSFPKAKDVAMPANVRVVTDISEGDLQEAMARGERVILFGSGPFKSLPMTYRIGMAGRCSGNFATVVKAGHPALEGMPHEGFCGWQFRRLMEGGAAVQLEAGIPFDPIIEVVSSDKCAIRQAALFEYAIGEGRLLVCSFAFQAEDPAAAWLRRRLVEYAASREFRPRQSLTQGQLSAVIQAPLVSGEADGNLARNPNDPSSTVRAGDWAQP